MLCSTTTGSKINFVGFRSGMAVTSGGFMLHRIPRMISISIPKSTSQIVNPTNPTPVLGRDAVYIEMTTWLTVVVAAKFVGVHV